MREDWGERFRTWGRGAGVDSSYTEKQEANRYLEGERHSYNLLKFETGRGQTQALPMSLFFKRIKPS